MELLALVDPLYAVAKNNSVTRMYFPTISKPPGSTDAA
jgi:hypothetical protein